MRKDNPDHPNNKLYRGEIDDFRTAMDIHVAAMSSELTLEDVPDAKASLKEDINRAIEAKAIYNEVIAEAERRVVAEFKRKGFDLYAEALESGDFSSLAI